jgi:hypothetical protein
MMQVLQLMLEECEAARVERQANLATLQHLAQLATNNNNNNGGNGNDEPKTKLRDVGTPDYPSRIPVMHTIHDPRKSVVNRHN